MRIFLALALCGFGAATAHAQDQAQRKDRSTCAQEWKAAKASGSTQSQAAYVAACQQGGSVVSAETSFPAPPRADTHIAAPPAPVASRTPVPGPPPEGATAICKDGSYSTAATHAEACVDKGGVREFFK